MLETVANGIENMGGKIQIRSDYHIALLWEYYILIQLCATFIAVAFCSMMTGGNFGKQVVKISD